MYRVINHDINEEVWGTADLYEAAMKIQEQNYFFMTGIQKYDNGKWIDIDGMHEEIGKSLEWLKEIQ